MNSRPQLFLTALLILSAILTQTTQVCAAPAPYLQYQAPEQAQQQNSFSTWSYVFSLAATFLVVLGLAYLTSRLVANKMRWSAGSSGDGKIISSLAFGAGRGVYLVEFSGRYLILGVTEHNINLLKEVSDEAEIEKLNALTLSSGESFDRVFKKQFSSLQQISQKFPQIFGGDADRFKYKRRSNQNSRVEAEEDNPEKR